MRNALYVKGLMILLLCVFTLWSGISLAGETGIRDSLHDLAALPSNQGANPFLFRTNQRCVFCHTPHAAESSVTVGGYWENSYVESGGQMLLWNRAFANAPSGYLLYDTSPTLDANVSQVRIYSLLCMSCHDGVSALNIVSNYPADVTQMVGPNGPIPPKDFGGPTKFADVFNGGPSGWQANIGERTNVSQAINLSNDHPVSFDYTAGLDAGLENPATVLATTPLKLFPVGVTPNVSLECPTCHDVHNEGSKDPYDPDLNPGGMKFPFLRMMIDDSAMCRACHLK